MADVAVDGRHHNLHGRHAALGNDQLFHVAGIGRRHAQGHRATQRGEKRPARASQLGIATLERRPVAHPTRGKLAIA